MAGLITSELGKPVERVRIAEFVVAILYLLQHLRIQYAAIWSEGALPRA